jgi:hypothetical protein
VLACRAHPTPPTSLKSGIGKEISSRVKTHLLPLQVNIPDDLFPRLPRLPRPPATEEQFASFEASMSAGCPPIIESFAPVKDALFAPRAGTTLALPILGGAAHLARTQSVPLAERIEGSSGNTEQTGGIARHSLRLAKCGLQCRWRRHSLGAAARLQKGKVAPFDLRAPSRRDRTAGLCEHEPELADVRKGRRAGR